MEQKTDWDLIKSKDWNVIRDEILNYKGYHDETNKERLLFLILKETGIKFNDIKLGGIRKDELGYVMTLFTDEVRPEMGIVGRYINKFRFSLHYRIPKTEEGNIILSFCPSLNYDLFSLGGNGFDVDCWFYYDVNRKEWIVK